MAIRFESIAPVTATYRMHGADATMARADRHLGGTGYFTYAVDFGEFTTTGWDASYTVRVEVDPMQGTMEAVVLRSNWDLIVEGEDVDIRVEVARMPGGFMTAFHTLAGELAAGRARVG